MNYIKLLDNKDIEYIFSCIKDEELKQFINKLIELKLTKITGDNMNFEEMTFKEIKENDLNNVKKYLENNKEYIHYDNDTKAWYIEDDEILDDLWYEMRTKLHPKELMPEINIMIENEMKIPKGNQSLADWQADKLDNMIRDTLPDDELY